MIALGSLRVLVAIAAACACALGCSGDRAAMVRSAGRAPAIGSTDNRAQGSASMAGSAGSSAHQPGSGSSAAAPSPAAGASGSAPDASAPAAAQGAVAKAKPVLDPNVSFDWPETPPGGGMGCQAGTYTGTFDCVFSDPSGLIPDVELTGPVSLTFTKSMDGEFLEITQGDFEAIGNDVIGGKAMIQGKLDCSSWMLDAMAVDGEWTIGDPQAPLVPGGALEGQITGTLDAATGTLSGQWNFADPDVGACPGTWSVMHTP
jgi:hypothetical protein